MLLIVGIATRLRSKRLKLNICYSAQRQGSRAGAVVGYILLYSCLAAKADIMSFQRYVCLPLLRYLFLVEELNF